MNVCVYMYVYTGTDNANLHLCGVVVGQAQRHRQDEHALCLLCIQLWGMCIQDT